MCLLVFKGPSTHYRRTFEDKNRKFKKTYHFVIFITLSLVFVSDKGAEEDEVSSVTEGGRRPDTGGRKRTVSSRVGPGVGQKGRRVSGQGWSVRPEE